MTSAPPPDHESDKLARYRSKRDFEATPEPDVEVATPGGLPQHPGSDGETLPRFVIQEHHATSMHWDLRLERGGVLVSWAVPRGIPTHPREDHLAVNTEDHPLSYLDFEGEIPRRQYGAGMMRIWDRGTYSAEKFRADEVIATFAGSRMRGRYALFRTRGTSWMIHRMDPPEDPSRSPLPSGLRPMLAVLADLPEDEAAYGFEVKWDGVRSIAYAEGGRARFESRNGAEITARYPELRGLGRALGSQSAVLDGEIVALDESGRPSFERLQRRMHVKSESVIKRLSSEVPVAYMVFDLLFFDGHPCLGLPYTARRRLLEGLELAGPSWHTPRSHPGEGRPLFEASAAQGLEGILAKRLDSTYEPGARSRAWLKVKHHRTADLVVGGYLPGVGGRQGRIGALLLGYHEPASAGGAEAGRTRPLRFAGRVGTGFTDAELNRLALLFAPLQRGASPFAGSPPLPDAVFLEPQLVARVSFAEWTSAGSLRHPSYQGLRDDLDPSQVERDPPP